MGGLGRISPKSLTKRPGEEVLARLLAWRLRRNSSRIVFEGTLEGILIDIIKLFAVKHNLKIGNRGGKALSDSWLRRLN